MTVSVVVPAYNASKFVGRCISNLRAQTCKDIEVIFVVDSKCTDDTMDMLSQMKDLEFPMRVIEQFDEGKAGGARNIGMTESKGEYIWFMDIDDFPSHTFIDEMAKIMDDTGCDISVCNFTYSHEPSHIDAPDGRYVIRSMSGIDALIALNDGKVSPNLWDKMFRRSLLIDNGLRFISGHCEDYDMIMKSFLESKKVCYSNKPLYTYYLHEASTSVGLSNKIAERDIQLFGDYARIVKERYPERYEEFCSMGLRHSLRSLTNADKDAFNALRDSAILKESCGYRQKDFAPEVFLFKLNKGLFYAIGSKMRKKRFSKDCFHFDEDF